MAKFIIAAFLVLFTIRADAQHDGIRFHQLSTVDGLSQSTVQVIIQDSRGYMWFGTQDGLNIMDREKGTFIKLTTNENEIDHLSNNQVNVLYEDNSGTLWIGTDNGQHSGPRNGNLSSIYRQS